MKIRSKKAFAAAGATLAVAAGAGGALAAGRQGHARPARPCPGRRRSPRTWASPRPSCGRSSDAARPSPRSRSPRARRSPGSRTAIYADVQTHLDRAVANGRLTAAQEQTLLARLKARLDDVVNHAFPPVGGPPRPALRPPRSPPTSASRRSQLRTRAPRRASRSRQVATAHGKTVAGLKAAILGRGKTRLDKAVAEQAADRRPGADDPRPAVRTPRRARRPDGPASAARSAFGAPRRAARAPGSCARTELTGGCHRDASDDEERAGSRKCRARRQFAAPARARAGAVGRWWAASAAVPRRQRDREPSPRWPRGRAAPTAAAALSPRRHLRGRDDTSARRDAGTQDQATSGCGQRRSARSLCSNVDGKSPPGTQATSRPESGSTRRTIRASRAPAERRGEQATYDDRSSRRGSARSPRSGRFRSRSIGRT